MNSALFGVIGSMVTLGLFFVGVSFRMGHQSARIEQLEKWRDSIRVDMHEISEQIIEIGRKLATIAALLEERTERRNRPRD